MFPWFSVCPPELPRHYLYFWLLLCAPWSVLAAPPLVANEVAPGVYVISGALADPSPGNRGQVVNTAFLVGRDGVVVVDSGANHRHGEAILAAVRRITRKPVKQLVNTHPHPQNVLGNSVFARLGVPILASTATRDKMGERCPRCLKTLSETVGALAMQGTHIRLPTRIVGHGERLTLAGRSLQFFQFGHGHTEGDLVVLDEATGTLLAGDLVYRDQIPHLNEANLRGWSVALNEIQALPFSVLVPGRGPVGGVAAVVTMQRYFDQLRARVAEAYAAGLSADETITRADLPEFSSWQGYATRHGINVQRAYFAIERADFEQQSTP